MCQDVDQKIPGLVVGRIRDEQGARDVGAQRLGPDRQERRVEVRPVLHAEVIACERRHGDAPRKTEIPGFLAALEGVERNLRGLARQRIGVIPDDVVLGDVVRLGELAVDELRLTGDLRDGLHLCGSEKVLYLQEHGQAVGAALERLSIDAPSGLAPAGSVVLVHP